MPRKRPSNVLKKQRRAYIGKKKRNTRKAQLLVRAEDKRLICTDFGLGKTHDFALFKKSRLPLLKTTCCLADSGYRGIDKHHQNARTPHKKAKNSR